MALDFVQDKNKNPSSPKENKIFPPNLMNSTIYMFLWMSLGEFVQGPLDLTAVVWITPNTIALRTKVQNPIIRPPPKWPKSNIALVKIVLPPQITPKPGHPNGTNPKKWMGSYIQPP
jgi:hypothetical protein